MANRIDVRRAGRLGVLAFMLLVGTSQSMALPFGEGVLSGVVLDGATRKPVSGAYVLAVYVESGGIVGGHSSSWCVRTLGATTGTDGKFSFPGDGRSSPDLYVIKKGFQQSSNMHTERQYGKWYEPAGKRFDTLWLDPVDPSGYGSQWVDCHRARYYEDAIAWLKYQEMLVSETKQYFGVDRTEEYIDIQRAVESLPRARMKANH